MKTHYEYIHFEKIENSWHVINTKHSDFLGSIAFFASWNQYCFHAVEQTLYSMGCLTDIIAFVGQLTESKEK